MENGLFPFGIYEKALPPHLTWPEKFFQAKQAGYGFIEISIDESDEKLHRLDWSREEKRKFKTDIETSGLFVPTMCLSGHRRFPIGSADEKLRRKGMEIMAKAIDFASETGIRIIQIAGYDAAPDEPGSSRTAGNYMESLGQSLVLASRKGVTLAIENVAVPFTDSIEKVMNIVNHFNSPYLQAYPDPGNSIAMGNDVETDLGTAVGHMSALHIKDTRPGIVRRIPFGTGTVDFVSLFKLIRKCGFTGPLIIEMWADDKTDTFDEIRQAREQMQEAAWKSIR